MCIRDSSRTALSPCSPSFTPRRFAGAVVLGRLGRPEVPSYATAMQCPNVLRYRPAKPLCNVQGVTTSV
eukprot:1026212-Rhodomonas_salina.2